MGDCIFTFGYEGLPLEAFIGRLKVTGVQVVLDGKLLEYLRLAKPDKKSVLGWKATDDLLDLIAKSNAAGPAKPTSKSASLMESLMLSLMLQTVLGTEAGNFHCYVLIRLGLIVEHTDGDWTPAPLLVKLFADSYDTRGPAPDPEAVYGVVYASK
jgi:hypothetical protein